MDWIEYNTEKIKGRYLYKFISEKFLIKFLETGTIWFSRSDKFGDKMECVMIKDLEKKVPDFKEIEARKRKHLISCFHEGNKETLAFWDTYAKTDEERRKYALRFNRKDFKERIELNTVNISMTNISKLVHGKVKYKNLIGANNEKLNLQRVQYPAFRKEYVFSYEREYRFDILLKNEMKELGYNYHIGNTNSIPFAILLNPLLDNKDYTKCLKTIQKSNFESKFRLSPLTKWLKPELWK
ncbi:MAG TPA: hypothetical protein VFW07_26595 [Parafilimonas sp.]|nr:hypothetical protein [Parafilimonas sp.]